MAIYIWWQPYYIIHGFDYYWIKWHIRKEKKANDNQSQVRWLIDSNCLTSFKIDRLFFFYFALAPFFCPTEWGKKTKPTVFSIVDLNIYYFYCPFNTNAVWTKRIKKKQYKSAFLISYIMDHFKVMIICLGSRKKKFFWLIEIGLLENIIHSFIHIYILFSFQIHSSFFISFNNNNNQNWLF